MGMWFEKHEHRVTYGHIVFEYDTADELGQMVGERGLNMPNPYEPGHIEFDEYNEAKWLAQSKLKTGGD